MPRKKTTYLSDPDDKRLGIMAIGSRELQLPDDALVSITLFERVTWWRFIINGILSHLVALQMKKHDGLLYAELGGRLGTFWGCTLSVWGSKSMIPFRDSGAHGTSMRKFRWIFGGQAQSYFLTFKANGRIPSFHEAVELGKTHGRHFDGNQLVRHASKPVWEFASDTTSV